MINHSGHSHPATSAARATCRKATNGQEATIDRFLATMERGYCPTPGHWTFYAASRFADYRDGDIRAAAKATIAAFAPSGDEATDRRRIANGYIITTSFEEIRRIALRCAS